MAAKLADEAGVFSLDNGDTIEGELYIRQLEVYGGVDGVAAISDGDTVLVQTLNSTPVTIYGNTADSDNWYDVRYFNRWFFGLSSQLSGGGRVLVHGRQAQSHREVNQA